MKGYAKLRYLLMLGILYFECFYLRINLIMAIIMLILAEMFVRAKIRLIMEIRKFIVENFGNKK